MQQVTGYVLVVLGLVLCLGQALAMLRGLFAPEPQRDVVEVKVVDLVKVLVDKVPVAAVGVLFVWLGAAILGWLR
jgi:sorbitol-specific phosphotransferase system component IIC